ncbi:FHA domain-containing protein [Williamsia sp.]|uniref:FHA domain-containing protein n=1 Tax=Williamsia sp. TaxID=1872085 RepID=UPI002F951B00
MTEEYPLEPDLVTCSCDIEWDRNTYSQCSHCLQNLWDLDRVAPSTPLREESAVPAGGETVLEGGERGRAGIDILACGRRHTIEHGQRVRLGRNENLETAEVFTAASNISRFHAELRFDGERLFVTDTNSSNGTFVNDQRLPADTEYELRPGQTLRLASNVPVDILWER